MGKLELKSFQMFPEGTEKGAISYLIGERVSKSRCIRWEKSDE